MTIHRLILVGIVFLLFAACHQESTVTRLIDDSTSAATAQIRDLSNIEQKFNPKLLRRFAPIHRVAQSGSDARRARLGRLLFFEPLLSQTGTVSCNSCHPLNQYGTTASRFSVGVTGKVGHRNAPTVYNAAGHFRQFWDGRAATLEDQVAGPLTAPDEMAVSGSDLEQKLAGIPGYRSEFELAYPDQEHPISLNNVKRAIADFERGLNTPSRWDLYLEGDVGALSSAEKEGARLFANLGCLGCHTGPYLGGTTYEKVGRVIAWPNQSDHGRMEVTRDPADDMKFKVPSLRNVAKTAPYFHDGSASTLNEAVRKMAVHQLGLYLNDAEVSSIVTWLGSLTGELPTQYISPPILPVANRL